MDINDTVIQQLIDAALAEDAGRGDVTSLAVIGDGARFEGVMSAREEMVVAGLPVALEVFRKLAPCASLEATVADGEKVTASTVLAKLGGPAREMLTAERTALNFVQHLSGIATLTRAYADRIAGTTAVLLDTRKTIPGLRLLAKYATRMGGARNHRFSLGDGVLIKDNHIAVCGGVREAVALAKAAGLSSIEVEVETLDQVSEAIEAGAKRLLLDNMELPTLRRAVVLARGRAETEASGGVNLETIRDIALTGVDFISVGRITQSAAAVDIGVDWRRAD